MKINRMEVSVVGGGGKNFRFRKQIQGRESDELKKAGCMKTKLKNSLLIELQVRYRISYIKVSFNTINSSAPVMRNKLTKKKEDELVGEKD